MSTAGIIAINQLALADAMKVFGRCCGSSAWAMQMARGRPYQDLTEMLRFADLKFRSLTRKDWLEAFIHLPDFAEVVKEYRDAPHPVGVSAEEVRTQIKYVDRLDRMLSRYQRKFGHRFIPFNDKASLETLLSEIANRYRNDPQDEMERICNHRRHISLHYLGSMISNYRPQEGDGVTVDSAVSGEKLPEVVPENGSADRETEKVTTVNPSPSR
jgi:2-oxo-4-hydroxy-4-carboxy--5-ureidoimidazoline (OHCU) decarboxylase